MGFLSGEPDIACEVQAKDNQLLCKARKGKEEAKILAEMGKDGKIKVIRHAGKKQLLDELWTYMRDNSFAKQGPVEPDF